MKIIALCPGCATQYDLTGWTAGDRVRCRCGALVVVPSPRVAEARVVRCASCGASRGAAGASCEFCGAVFSAVDKGWASMCPKCFCRLPNDARFCVECGFKLDPDLKKYSEAAAGAELKCPRCTVALQTRMLEKVVLHECGACAGVWLNIAVFEEICKDKDTQSVATRGLHSGRRATKFEIPADEQVKYIPCPECRNLMNRNNFGHVSGVIIDTCSRCGVWLDNQELNRIVKFIQDGGLSRAREFEQRDSAERAKGRKLAIPGVAMQAPFDPAPGRNLTRHGAGILTDVLVELARHFLR